MDYIARRESMVSGIVILYKLGATPFLIFEGAGTTINYIYAYM